MAPQLDDDAPFSAAAAFASGLSGLAHLAGGEHARLGVEADHTRRFRLAVETWARARGLWSIDGQIKARTEDGIDVTAALFDMTEETAVLRSVAPAPIAATLVVEPKRHSLSGMLAKAFGRRPKATNDPSFDERFDVHASDDAAVRTLVCDNVRTELLAFEPWCKVRYADGDIEVRLDTPRLAGVHLLRAIKIIAPLARARAHVAAYR
jgi:hypothetical protein